MKFIQWDESDTSLYINFFKDMLLSRFHVLVNKDISWDSLIRYLFDSYDSFILAALCSHGIPRRFWEILRQAYSYSDGKITYSNIDNAIQEVTNSQILAPSRVNEYDFSILHAITRSLNSINIEIRGKNNTKRGPTSNIPQNLYFTVPRASLNDFSNLLLNGIIHDKSRMKASKRRSIPTPVFCLDLSVAYTQRIVPPKGFITVILNDLPKCADNDYPQAPTIKEKSVMITDVITQQSKDSKVMIPDNEKNEGTIKIVKNYYGFIVINGNGKDLFFNLQDRANDYKVVLPGDKVQFKIRNAKICEISLLERATPSFGCIKSIESNFSGHIESEKGELIFFYLLDVDYETRSKLLEGTKIKYYLAYNKTGVIAQNIELVTS